MNWLAHIFLSGSDPEVQIGGLMPDVINRTEVLRLKGGYAVGAKLHVEIDGFTDRHPVFLQSKRRFSPMFRRFSGIIVDVAYDHFLARDFQKLTGYRLRDFAASFYESLLERRNEIPELAYKRLVPTIEDDWLCSCTTVSGVGLALRRISRRLKRPFALCHAAAEIETDYTGFESDFLGFFPEVRKRFGRQ